MIGMWTIGILTGFFLGLTVGSWVERKLGRWAPHVVVLLLLTATTAHAQDAAGVAPSIPPGDDRIEHLGPRAAAPFEGMLLDMDTAIRWTHRIEWYRAELQLRLRTTEEILRAERTSHENELQLQHDSYERQIQGLRDDVRTQAHQYEEQLAHYREPEPFYESWGFAFGMGAVAVVVVGAVIFGLVLGLR